MNKEGSAYTFTFATIMVVVVATVLAVAAISLKPYQQENLIHEKMMNILKTVGVESTMKTAPDLFSKYVKERIVLNASANAQPAHSGPIDPKDAGDAFNVDVRGEYKEFKAGTRTADAMEYPVFICETPEGRFTVLPMVGTGLWGPIWGYIALKEDMNTVYGATFDHQGETPGLGAEIKQPHFQSMFKDKQIHDESGTFTSIQVVKGGADPSDPHGVDAITGGTITSKGVDEMLNRTLQVYEPYLKSNAK